MLSKGGEHFGVFSVALRKLWWFRVRDNMTMPITVEDGRTSHLANTEVLRDI
jgi:hypothetical protein